MPRPIHKISISQDDTGWYYRIAYEFGSDDAGMLSESEDASPRDLFMALASETPGMGSPVGYHFVDCTDDLPYYTWTWL